MKNLNNYVALATERNVTLNHIAAYSRDRELWMHVWRGNHGDYETSMDAIDDRLFQRSGKAARYAARHGQDHRQVYIDHVIRTQAKWFIGEPVTIRILGKNIKLTAEVIEDAKINI